MPDAFGLAAIVTKIALYLGVMTAAGTAMATLMFQLERTRGLAASFAVLGLAARLSFEHFPDCFIHGIASLMVA